MDDKKNMTALALWDKMKDYAVERLCRGKCRAKTPDEIRARDIFFSDEEVVMKPGDFAEGEDLKVLETFLAGNRDRREWKRGVWIQVEDDLTVTAKDGSRIFVLFYGEKNRPKAQLIFREGSRRVKSGRKSFDNIVWGHIAAQKFEDAMCGLTIWDGCRYTEVKEEELYISPSSIKKFYTIGDGVKSMAFLHLTRYICENWAGRLCSSKIVRHTPNMDGSTNWFGLCLPLWHDELVCGSYAFGSHGAYTVDKDITKEELDAVCRGMGRHVPNACSAIMQAYEDSMMTNDQHAAVTKKAKEEVRKVTSIVDAHSQDILDAVCRKYGIDPSMEPDEKYACLRDKEGSFGLDCGFLYFRFLDDDRDRLVRRAGTIMTTESSSFYADGRFSIDVPYATQSTTLDRAQAEEVVRLAAEEGIGLSYFTILD